MNRNRNRKPSLSLSACLTLAIALAAPLAHADTAPREEVVRLAPAAGAQVEIDVMTRRIEQAAHRVCVPMQSKLLAVRRHWEICVDQAMAEATDELQLAISARADRVVDNGVGEDAPSEMAELDREH